MRVTDRAVPTVPAAAGTRPPWFRQRLVIALERLPQSAYVWDDPDPTVTWDRADLVWDAPQIGSGYSDVFCDFQGCEIIHGEPDEHELYRASECRLQLLDPGDGRYRLRTVDGRLVFYAPGRRLAVYTIDGAGAVWWLFHGRIASWRDELQAAGSVQIVAYSGTAELAQDTGLKDWSAGTADQFPGPRLDAIAAAVAYSGGPIRRDLGDVPLNLVPRPGGSALEAMQQAAWSDGGLVYSDADDTFVGRDRRWRGGRADQTRKVVYSDNVCGADVVLWDPVIADDDSTLAGRVVLQNNAALTATATGGTLVQPAQVYTHPDVDVWKLQADGNKLAADIALARSNPALKLDTGRVHLEDGRFPGYWPLVVDTRLGDRIRLWHDQTNPDGTVATVDVDLIVETVHHSITPESWLVDVETSPAVAFTAVELWDRTVFAWDATDPLNVWR